MSIRSVRLSNPEPLIVKADEDPIMFRQELKFFYTELKFFYTGEEDHSDNGDLDIVVEEEEDDDDDNQKLTPVTFKAHRFMLASRSDYFKAMLSSNFKDSKTASIRLDASIFNNTSLNLILTYIYTGNLTSHSKPLTLETCEWVWIGADFLGIKGLCDDCVHKISTKAHYFTCTCAECQV
ncbi:6938_t:CDS:2, partial [Entrophospora sp. SA101]